MEAIKRNNLTKYYGNEINEIQNFFLIFERID